MSSLSISYLTGIVLASCGAFGAVYVGNMIFPIKGAFGDFKFDDTNRNKIKEWLKPFFEKRAQQDDLVTGNISPDTEQPLTAREELGTLPDISNEMQAEKDHYEGMNTEERKETYSNQRDELGLNRQSGGAESSMVDDATNFLTVPLDKWTEIGENVGIIYTKFNEIRKVCHTQTDIKQRTALIKLCNLMAQKYDLIIQEIERKLSANEKLIKYEQIFLDAYNILEALYPKETPETPETSSPKFRPTQEFEFKCDNFIKYHLTEEEKTSKTITEKRLTELITTGKDVEMTEEETRQCLKRNKILTPNQTEQEKKDEEKKKEEEAETDTKINTMFDGGRRRKVRG